MPKYKHIRVLVEEEKALKFNVFCTKKGTKMSKFLRSYVNELLEKDDQPPIGKLKRKGVDEIDLSSGGNKLS